MPLIKLVNLNFQFHKKNPKIKMVSRFIILILVQQSLNFYEIANTSL